MQLVFIVFGLVVPSLNAVDVPADKSRGLQCFGQWQAVMIVNTEGPGVFTFSDANGPIGSVRVADKEALIGCVAKGATFAWKAEK